MSNDESKFLDVESGEQRQHRIGALLGRLTTSSSSAPVSPNPLLNIGKERSPGPIGPPAEPRVKAFIPAISASNKALSEIQPEDINIENVLEDEEQYIEMNLGLGVFEAKHSPKSGPRPTSASSDADSSSDASSSESESDSELSRSGSGSGSEEDSESDSSSSDDDSDSESQSGSSADMRPISSRPIKPLPRRVSQQTKG